MSRWIPAVVTLGLVLALTTMPFLYMRAVTGVFLPDVLPTLQPDSDYYLAQIRDVLDGNLWLGNPYIQEYAHLRSPSVILAVWIAAAPGFFGLSMQHIFLFNFLFYSVLTGMLLYALLLRVTERNVWLSTVMTVVGVAYVHNLLLRPVVMQVIFPVFLLFLLVLETYLRRKTVLSIVVLGAVAVLSFYLYLFLWMIVFTTLGLLTVWMFWKRKWHDFFQLCCMWAGIFLCIAPEALHLYERMSDPLFLETASRLGIVRTHLVGLVTMLNAKYLILSLLGIIILHPLRHTPWKSGAQTLVLVLIATLIVTFSNMLTGTNMNLITHPWRLGLLLTVASCAWFVAQGIGTPRSRLIAFGCAFLLFSTIVMHVAIRTKTFTYFSDAHLHRTMQEYAVPLGVLADLPHGVVLADERLSCLIPIYTPHTVVFCSSAYYHPIPTGELLERSFLTNLSGANEDTVRSAMLSVKGVGPERRASALNRKNAFCRFTGLCTDDGIVHTAFDEAGGDAAVTRGMQIVRELERDTTAAIDRFHVSYTVIDLADEKRQTVRGETVYKDARWQIVKR